MEGNSFGPLSTDSTSMWHKNTPLNTYGNATGPVAVYSNDTGPQQGLMSLSTTLLIVDIVKCGIQPVLALLGLVGNSLTLIVILHQGFQQTTNIILFGLAVTDLLYVLLSLRSPVECFARQFDDQVALEVDLFSQARLVMLDSELACLSRLYTCFIAVERFIVVRFPLKASRLLTKTTTIIISGILWILASLSCVVCFLGLEVKEIHNPADNATSSKVLAFTEFFKQNAEVLTVMSSLILPLISRHIPIIIVFVCTVIILRTLGQSRLQRKQMTSAAASGGSDQQQGQQITKALLAVCLVFLLTNVPGILVSLFRFVYVREGFANVGRYQNTHKVTVSVLFLFTILNSSVNFMLYVIFNSKFAAASHKLIPPCWRKAVTGRLTPTLPGPAL